MITKEFVSTSGSFIAQKKASEGGGGILITYRDFATGEMVDEVVLRGEAEKTARRNFSEGSGPQWDDSGYHSDELATYLSPAIKVTVSDIANGGAVLDQYVLGVSVRGGSDTAKVLATLIFGRTNRVPEGARLEDPTDRGRLRIEGSAHVRVTPTNTVTSASKSSIGGMRFQNVGPARRVRFHGGGN